MGSDSVLIVHCATTTAAPSDRNDVKSIAFSSTLACVPTLALSSTLACVTTLALYSILACVTTFATGSQV